VPLVLEVGSPEYEEDGVTAPQVWLDIDLTPQPSSGFAYMYPTVQVTDSTDGITITTAPAAQAFAGSELSYQIYATDNANMAPSSWAWFLDFSQNPYVPGRPAPTVFFAPAGPCTFTATNATPCVFTWVPTAGFSSFSGVLPNGTVMTLAGGSLPAGFTAATPYYVVSSGTDTFELSATRGGSPIASTGTGSGSFTVTRYSYSGLVPASSSAVYTPYATETQVLTTTLPTLANASVTTSGALALNTITRVTATSSVAAMTLPSPSTGALVVCERETASTANVTITGNIRGTGGTVVTLSLSNESEMFFGTSSTWLAIAGHKTLGSLDSRYIHTVNAVTYGADPSGTADSTTAIQAAITAAGAGTVLLPQGTYLLNTSAALTLATAGCTVRGEGPSATIVTMGASMTGAAAFVVAAGVGYCAISDMTITCTSSTTASNPARDAIDLNGGRLNKVDNVFFQYINGWCVNSVATSTNAGYATTLTRLSGLQCAGGVHIQSNASVTWGAQHFLSNLNFQQIGVGTGASANLDCYRFEDCFDVIGVNFNDAISNASTGSTLNIIGNCSTIYMTNMDLGAFPNSSSSTNAVIRIQDGTNGSPTDVRFVQGTAQQGQNGLYVTGGAKKISFQSYRFFNNFASGARVANTGAENTFNNCSFNSNGNGGVANSGTYYDLTWTGTATGKVLGCQFSSPIVAVGANGVQNTMDFTGAGVVEVADCNCYGTSTTATNAFSAGTPKYVFRTLPFNPKGATTIAVPSSGSAASGRNFDMTFYITAGSSTCSCVVTGSSNFTYVVPIAGTAQIFVPAGATITPTYANAPTWVVYGN
jgi:hypothetical protein